MKVPIDEYAVIDLDAPTLRAVEVSTISGVRWMIWCKHCRLPHLHGPAEGHREGACSDDASPYKQAGYNLALWTYPGDD